MSDFTLVQPACNCRCHTTNMPTPETLAPADCVYNSSSVTAVMAEAARLQSEVARLQAEAILALIKRDTLIPPSPVHRHDAAPTQRTTNAAELPDGMLISSSVGSISVADWDAMREARLRRLDSALTKIVAMALIPSVPWKQAAEIIQRELAAVGFVFNTVCDSTRYSEKDSGTESEDKSLSDIVRMRAAARGTTNALGTALWMNEMVMIAVRLMELRGV